jgi:ATP-dependent Clp protease adaptor protein ClpS
MILNMNLPTLEPAASDLEARQSRWMVLIYNNDHNSTDEVMHILMVATSCDAEEAFMEMWEAHTFGKAAVHFASKSECELAAGIISTIGVKTSVQLEWED